MRILVPLATWNEDMRPEYGNQIGQAAIDWKKKTSILNTYLSLAWIQRSPGVLAASSGW